MTPVISAERLVKRYGTLTAVAGISFDVHDGEIFGLLGPNGAGKTTCVEMVQGLRRPDAGRIRVLGIDPDAEPDRLRHLIGSQLQESALPQRIKVWEALDLFSALLPAGPPWRTVLDEWGLSEKADAPFGSLSGGQRQRLLVALALVNAPKVVFLDEMTTGLDPSARRASWDLILRIREEGTTVVLVTHFMEEAERLCDRVAIVNRGSIIATGKPADLARRFADTVTVRFTTDCEDLGFLDAVPGVSTATWHAGAVEVQGVPTLVPHLGKALIDRGLVPDDVTVERPDLEDVYLRLTGDRET